jgi:hypothetical protein
VDEIQWQRGHKYLTLVYQIDEDCRRLLWVGKDRTTKTFPRFFRMFGKERSSRLRFVCSDMWKPYLKVIAKKAGQAVHVLDRFHVMAKMNKAIDEVRATEAKRLERAGYEPVLKHSRWCLLKRKENLTVLGVLLPGMCGEVPRRVVYPHHAIEDRSDEEGGPNVASSSRVDTQLVPSGRCHFSGDCGGSEQQSKTDDEKSVWLSDGESHRNRPISPTWRPPRTRIHP